MPRQSDQSTQRSKAVVLLSGGMDSCVCAALAARSQEVAALHFSYGQRTEARERRSFEAICDRLGVRERLLLQTGFFRQIGGSALTDESIAVPEVDANGASKIGVSIPVTYVPFRNAHLLAAAVSWAEVLGANSIYIGAVEQDSSGYPDCRPAFYGAYHKLIEIGTKAGVEGKRLEIKTPLIGLKKNEIVELGLKLAAPFELTWSCYSGQDSACGRCESCVLRLRAFRAAGQPDPLPYLSDARKDEREELPGGRHRRD